MALETLKGIKKVRNETVVVMDDLRAEHPERFGETGAMDHKWFEETIRPNAFIYVRNDKNSLSFTIQNGPVKEFGKNGCQVVDILAVCSEIISGLNRLYPDPDNQRTLAHLEQAIHFQDERTRKREARGVEGRNQA